MYHMLYKCSTYEVAKQFFWEPNKKMSLAEISRKTKLAHTSVTKHLKILLKYKIISKEIEIKNTRKFPIYKANKEGKEYKKQKKIHNYSEIINSKIIEYLEENTYPECIILFGSYQKGEDKETSDIDLYVQTKTKNIKVEKFEKLLKRKIQIHNSIKIRDYDEELQKNIINGTSLSGFLDISLDNKVRGLKN